MKIQGRSRLWRASGKGPEGSRVLQMSVIPFCFFFPLGRSGICDTSEAITISIESGKS